MSKQVTSNQLRRSFLIAAHRRGSDFSILLNQLGYAVRHLCTYIDPMINSLQVQTHPFLCASCNRVEKSQPLDKAAVSCSLAVGHSEVIKGPFIATTSGQANGNHVLVFLMQSMQLWSQGGGPLPKGAVLYGKARLN